MNEQPTFPGLEVGVPNDAPRTVTESPMLSAARMTLTELREQGLLRREHGAIVQLTLELAQAVAAGVRSGRASAVALAARELRETIAMLPIPDDDVPAENGDWEAFRAAAESEAS